jgi:hypothetical protein
MLDQGQFAERRRRLALAGIKAAMLLFDLPNFPRSEFSEMLIKLEAGLVDLRHDLGFWPLNRPPEIEDVTVFGITKEGRVSCEQDKVA